MKQKMKKNPQKMLTPLSEWNRDRELKIRRF